MANAAVLPVPVCAWPIKSVPSSAGGINPAWMGVGSRYSASSSAASMTFDSPMAANAEGGRSSLTGRLARRAGEMPSPVGVAATVALDELLVAGRGLNARLAPLGLRRLRFSGPLLIGPFTLGGPRAAAFASSARLIARCGLNARFTGFGRRRL